MQRVTRENLSVVFDRRIEPVATIDPGVTVVVPCEDARSDRTRTPETATTEYLLKMKKTGWYDNPVTGPISVTGARAGDTLAVHISKR
ncbi:MAG: acetamidase/formamidase family protein [Thermomicrobiales bacterium]